MGAADPVEAAHIRLLHDRSIQFAFGARPEPPTIPPWLRSLGDAIGKALHAAGPTISIGMWSVLIVGLIAVLAFLGWELFFAPGVPGRATPLNLRAGPDPLADRARLRALLADADALAAQGRYAEAVHVLLFRSIADVEDRRAALVTPSLTSRELAAMPELPTAPRAAFGEIAHVVERAVFGQHPVGLDGWRTSRAAYERFIAGDAWVAA